MSCAKGSSKEGPISKEPVRPKSAASFQKNGKESFDSLLQELVAVADTIDPNGGISREKPLMDRILSHKDLDLDKVFALLLHKSPEVRDLATVTLFQLDQIPENRLDILIKSYQSGNSSSTYLIAKIKSPRAVEFLVREFEKKPVENEPLDMALIYLGEKSVPYLVGYFKSSKGNMVLLNDTLHIFSEIRNKASSAVGPLLAIAADQSLDKATRVFAVRSIGAIGTAQPMEQMKLQKFLNTGDPELQQVVEDALISVKASIGVDILVSRFGKDWDCVILRDLAEIGTVAASAGPAVVAMLDRSDNPFNDVKACAARTLGYIGYMGAVDRLIRLLNDDKDWEAAYVAADSLGWLRATQAIPALEKASRMYWYYPVRHKAAEALERFKQGGARPSEDGGPRRFAWEYLSYESPEETPDEVLKECKTMVKQSLTVGSAVGKDVLEKMSYQTTNIGYVSKIKGGINQTPMTGYMPNIDQLEKVEETRTQVPNIGIVVKDGYIVASDRRQGAPVIQFVDRKGNSYNIFNGSAYSIVDSKVHGIVATCGPGGEFSHGGTLFKVSKNKSNRWVAVPWIRLPGSPGYPKSMTIVKDGIIVKTTSSINVELPGDRPINERFIRKDININFVVKKDGHPVECK